MRRPRSIVLVVCGGLALPVSACALLVDTNGLVSAPEGLPDDASPTIDARADGRYGDGPTDGGREGAATMFASCADGGGPGLTGCGPDGGASCCESLLVTGGTFLRSFDNVYALDKNNLATVSGFRLDRFEVTGARFRAFVGAVVGGWRPASGAGRHTHLPGGGLTQAGGPLLEPGWDGAWNSQLFPTKAEWTSALSCDVPATWTSAPGGNEQLPINCITRIEAYAFCIWDGGFLPSETEWNYAATGGDEQRVFPWSTPPQSSAIDCTFGNFRPDPDAAFCAGKPVPPGLYPKGAARWGHADMSGNLYERTLDGYADYLAPCIDCVNLRPGQPLNHYIVRGGSYYTTGPTGVSANARPSDPETLRATGFGFRCARTP